jgi:broad specificity polyphosphatase/5'/3'-nucleotidase SurE
MRHRICKKDILRQSIKQPKGAVKKPVNFPSSMQEAKVVTIPALLKLPVQGEYEGGRYVYMFQHDHHAHSDRDGADIHVVHQNARYSGCC